MHYTALGSRLKRAGVLMQSISQVWLKGQGCDLPSAQMPVLATLYKQGPASTGEMAQRLGIAQPGVSRMIDQMEKAGWVVATTHAKDRRVREIRLSDAGAALAHRADTEFWPYINRVVARLCADLDGDFLTQLGALERRLDAGEMDRIFSEMEAER